MAKLIGNAPNQVPTNADLGSMAFEDKKNYATTSSPIYQPYRNIIINGDMNIAQRGTSFSGINSGSPNFGVDRFNFEVSSLGAWTISQDTDVPTGQGFAKSLKLDCTTADASPGANDLAVLTQNIEGQNLQYLKKGTANAQSLTLSFWVKSNKTGTYIAELRDVDNNRTINKSYTINSSNTWEKKTIIYDGDTTGTLDNDNGKSFQLNLWLGGGSGWTSGTLQTSWGSSTLANRQVGQVNLADSTANEFYITGVQLEAGTTASDFEFLPYDVNLGRCLRYFQFLSTYTGYSLTSTTTVNGYTNFPTMRTSPSISSTDVITVSDAVTTQFTQSSENIVITGDGSSKTSASIQVRNLSGLTSRRNYSVIPNSTGKITLSAEL
jgi:hypothetical protein